MLRDVSNRVVIYGRVSQDRGEGKSVDDQLAECRTWANREAWVIVAEHRDDGISASRYANGKVRPGWQSTMELITTGRVDLLVVWEVSRATRDRAVWSALLAACQERDVRIGAGGRIHDPADPEDGFMLDLQAALATRESGITSKRIQRAVLARASEGMPHGKVPYGYRRVYDPETRRLLRQEPDPVTGPVVREIAARLLMGEATYAVATDLDARGIVAPRGGRWDLTQVKRMAISATNAGLRTHRGKVIGPAQWPALITVTDHHLLVGRLTDPARKTIRDGSVKHLLSMIAMCGVCGGLCRRVKNRTTPSYSCRDRFCVTRSQPHVDDLVTELIIDRLSSPDMRKLLTDHPDPQTEAAVELARELRARLAEFETEATAGRINAASFGRIEAKLTDQIRAAERAALPRGLPAVITETMGPDVAGGWRALSVPQRREIIRALAVPVVLPTGKGTRVFDPASIRVVWRHTVKPFRR